MASTIRDLYIESRDFLNTASFSNVLVTGASSQNVSSFIILRLGEGITSFNKITVLTFLVKKVQ